MQIFQKNFFACRFNYFIINNQKEKKKIHSKQGYTNPFPKLKTDLPQYDIRFWPGQGSTAYRKVIFLLQPFSWMNRKANAKEIRNETSCSKNSGAGAGNDYADKHGLKFIRFNFIIFSVSLPPYPIKILKTLLCLCIEQIMG